MAGSFIRLDISAEQQLKDAAAQLKALSGDLRPLQADIGEYLLKTHRERYRDEVAPDGSAWDDLKESTLARKSDNRILQDRGTMRDTYAYQNQEDELFFGTNAIQGATHQYGREDAGIVARPHLGFSDDDPDAILDMIHHNIQTSIAESL